METVPMKIIARIHSDFPSTGAWTVGLPSAIIGAAGAQGPETDACQEESPWRLCL